MMIVTGIKYKEVRKIINHADLLPDIEEKKRKERYERAKTSYCRGMSVKELLKIIGLSDLRLFMETNSLEPLRQEWANEQRYLGSLLQGMILKKSNGNPAFIKAHLYHITHRTLMDFKTIYQRSKDIVKGYNTKECAKRWNISTNAAQEFRRKINEKNV
jgi:hypothetical protein